MARHRGLVEGGKGRLEEGWFREGGGRGEGKRWEVKEGGLTTS